MRVLVATDAWAPQVNGVVRTLTSLARTARGLGVNIEFLSPDGFTTFPVPTYPGLRLAFAGRRQIAQRIEQAKPDAIHIATEGPIGHAVRAYCRRHGRPFTTSYTTRFPEYISARVAYPGELDLRGLAAFPCCRHGHHGRNAVADERIARRAAFLISACGRAASTPNCSGPTAPSISDFRGRSSSRSAASPSKRTSTHFCLWICRAPKW